MKKDVKKKTSWADITITDWKRMQDIINRPLDSDMEKDMAICALVNGISEGEMYNMPVAQARMMMAELEWMKKPADDFSKKWHAKYITINGKKCKVTQNIESMSMNAYLDFTNWWETRFENQGKVLATFLIPQVDGKYVYNEGYDALEFAQEIEDTLSIEMWNVLAFFLLKQWLYGIRASLILGAWQIQKMIWWTKDKETKKMLRKKRREVIEQLRYMRLSV